MNVANMEIGDNSNLHGKTWSKSQSLNTHFF